MKQRTLITALIAATLLVACHGGSSSTGNVVTQSVATQATASQTLAIPDGTWTGAYYTSWGYWRNPNFASVKHIGIFDQKAPSYIAYAFFAPKISTDSSSKVGYGGAPLSGEFFKLANGSVADLDYYYEPDIANKNYADMSSYIAKNNGTKLIASIGGWSYGPRFAQFAQDANYDVNSAPAQAFLDSIYKILTSSAVSDYPVFDGINIDWEFPGYRDNSPTLNAPQEGPFFQNLMIALRQKVDQAALDSGIPKVMSVALPVSIKKMTATSTGQAPYGIDWTKLHGLFDWVDLMALDMHGEFDAADSSLMTPKDQAPVEEILPVISFLEAEGFQAKQIVLGIPTYTRQQMVNIQPSAANNYTYGLAGSMNPALMSGMSVYSPDIDFTDPPNVVPYWPAGGMVDNTGVYSYACMVASKVCAAPVTVPASTDNRGLFGQPLPKDLTKVMIADATGNNVPHAWAYSPSLNVVVQSPLQPHGNKAGASIDASKTIGAYAVYSWDNPETVQAKINQIVKKLGLGGAWFWDIENDTFESSALTTSLYGTATATLGTNTQPWNKPLGFCNGLKAWSNAKTYVSGNQVYENNEIYQANWWNQNNEPAKNNGSGKVWKDLGACPNTTPVVSPTPSVTPSPKPSPSPSPSPKPSPAPSPSVAPVPSPSPSPVPTVSPSPSPSPSPKPSPSVSPSPTPTTMPTLPTWPAGIASYTDGTRVFAADGNEYECKPYPYSGWCKQTGYDPTGIYGGQAWAQVGTAANPAPAPVLNPNYPVWPNGISGYKAGTIVNGYGGNLFQCRPWPYSGWCTQKAYNPYGLYGSQAWVPYKAK